MIRDEGDTLIRIEEDIEGDAREFIYFGSKNGKDLDEERWGLQL
jgi:hypothetical protein